MVRKRRIMAMCLSLCLAGCDGNLLPKAVNIAELQLMRTMAADVGEGDGWKVSVSGDLEKESAGGEASAPMVITGQGETVFGAVLELEQTGQGKLELGHLQECVIGEELAQQGISQLTDYLERDFAVRTGTRLYLVKEETGEKILEETASDRLAPTDWLTVLSGDGSMGGDRWPYLLRTYIGDMEDNGTALLPVVKLVKQQEASELTLDGLAWFRDHKLGGYLTEQETKGACLLLGYDQMDVFAVPLSGGGIAGVELVKAECSFQPVFDRGGRLNQVTARIRTKGRLNQLPPGANPGSLDLLKEVNQGFQSQIAQACQEALNRSRKENTDFLHIRRQLMTAHGVQMNGIGKKWDQYFSKLELKAEVDGQIERSGDTERPAESREDLG